MAEDWEAKYKELKRERDEVLMPLLKAALCHVREDDDDPVELYETSIAPSHLSLPVVMTECTPAERQRAISSMEKKLGGKTEWSGYTVEGRPAVALVTAKSTADGVAGLKKRQKRRGSTALANPTITILCSHLVLIRDGAYPREGYDASHLCHTGKCLNRDHLIWERADLNKRRKKCARWGRCVCCLDPPCIFGAH